MGLQVRLGLRRTTHDAALRHSLRANRAWSWSTLIATSLAGWP
jgi:hypothetical protein